MVAQTQRASWGSMCGSGWTGVSPLCCSRQQDRGQWTNLGPAVSRGGAGAEWGACRGVSGSQGRWRGGAEGRQVEMSLRGHGKAGLLEGLAKGQGDTHTLASRCHVGLGCQCCWQYFGREGGGDDQVVLEGLVRGGHGPGTF